MRIVLKKSNTTLLHAAFFLYLFCEILFEHTIISQMAMLAFIGLSVVLTMRPRWSMLLTAYALFIGWAAINIMTGNATSTNTATPMLRTLCLNLAFLYAVVCYCRYVNDLETVMKLYMWIALVFSIPCLIGGISSFLQGTRLRMFGINANRIAKVMAYAMIIAAYFQSKQTRRKWRLRDSLPLLLFVTIILFTGSRKGLLIPFAGIYVLVCARKPGKFVKYSLTVLIVGAVALVLLLNIEPLYNLVGYRVEALLQFLQGEDFVEDSIAGRGSYISIGWEMAKQKPLIGHGLDCFRYFSGTFKTYSHCNYIEVLFSTGWIGAIAYYMPYAFCLLRMMRFKGKKPDIINLFIALMIPYLICDYMNVTYYERTSLVIPAIIMTGMGKTQQLKDNLQQAPSFAFLKK